MVALLVGPLPKGEHVLSSSPSLPLGWPLNHYMEILVTALSLEVLNPSPWPQSWLCLESGPFAYQSPLHLTLPLL